VVVAVGFTFVEPLADADMNVPGVMAILVAPGAAQCSVLLAPELMLVGLAAKAVTVGNEPFADGELGAVPEPHPVRPAHHQRSSAMAQNGSAEAPRTAGPIVFLRNQLRESMGTPLATVGYSSLVIAMGVSYWPQVQNKFAGLGG
jgi:hypothetical protein